MKNHRLRRWVPFLCNIFENLTPAQGRGDNVEVLLSAEGGPAFLESRLVDDFSPDESAAEAFPAYRTLCSAFDKRGCFFLLGFVDIAVFDIVLH